MCHFIVVTKTKGLYTSNITYIILGRELNIMKYRISITLEENVIFKLKEAIRMSPDVKNQSHFVEMAIKEKIDNSILKR